MSTHPPRPKRAAAKLPVYPCQSAKGYQRLEHRYAAGLCSFCGKAEASAFTTPAAATETQDKKGK